MTVTAPTGDPAGNDSPSRTTVGTVRTDDQLTITVYGELDASSGTALDTAVDDVLATDPPERVAIDLAHLEFCVTAGVRALARAYRLAVARGVDCRVIRARPHVAWLLNATDMPGTDHREP